MFFLIFFLYYKSTLLKSINIFHKNKTIIFGLLLLFFFYNTTFTRASQVSEPDPEIEYGWIEYLFNQGETALAINEGLRFIHFYPTHKFSDSVRMFIGKSYLKENDFDKAMETFKDLSKGAGKQEIREEAKLWLCNSLIKHGKYKAARQICDDFLIRYPHSLLKDRAQYQKAWAFLKEWRWEDAENSFREIDQNSRLFSASQEIIKETRELSRQKGKSLTTAGILSIILPGSGYIYAGKLQTGFTAFIVNGVFIGASIEAFDNDLPILGSIIGLLEIGWYSGTIYGSAQSAKRYNYRFREEKILSLNERFTLPLLDIRF
jgi:outer membrane protein assembly factor BamD (BamD/ComL family)